MDWITEQLLTHSSGRQNGREKPQNEHRHHKPGWAEGLRKLYDCVVEEPLPEGFENLLRKLGQATVIDRLSAHEFRAVKRD